MDATILNTALPAIAHSLNRSPLAMQSAIISYTLTVAMLIPVSGWLADRFGTRRIFMLAVSLFTLGSLACALSTSLWKANAPKYAEVPEVSFLRTYVREDTVKCLCFYNAPDEDAVVRAREAVTTPIDRLHHLAGN